MTLGFSIFSPYPIHLHRHPFERKTI